MGKLNVDGTEIQVLQIKEDDYISLTDMVRKIDNGPALIEKWLRNKNTIEFLGIWEEAYHADSYYLCIKSGFGFEWDAICEWISLKNCERIYFT